MGKQTINVPKSDNGLAALAIVAVVGMVLATVVALILAFLGAVLIGATVTAVAVGGFKAYQLHVYKTVSLAAIQARMPPPLPPKRRTVVGELMRGREKDAA